MCANATRGRWALLVFAVFLGIAKAQNPADSAKGPFGDNRQPAVKVELVAFDASSPRVVSADHPFRNGDRFRLRFELSRSSYVYLLNRTLAGDPRELRGKGISVLDAEDAQAGRTGNEAYRLIYPTGAAVVRVPANQPQGLPADNRFLAMDNRPGVEKLLLVVSEEPVDIDSMFDLSTGLPKGVEFSEDKAISPRRDSVEGVLARLRARPVQPGGRVQSPPPTGLGVPVNKTLVEAWQNTRVQHVVIPTKGIEQVEDAVIAVQVNDRRPMMVELTLSHYAR